MEHGQKPRKVEVVVSETKRVAAILLQELLRPLQGVRQGDQH